MGGVSRCLGGDSHLSPVHQPPQPHPARLLQPSHPLQHCRPEDGAADATSDTVPFPDLEHHIPSTAARFAGWPGCSITIASLSGGPGSPVQASPWARSPTAKEDMASGRGRGHSPSPTVQPQLQHPSMQFQTYVIWSSGGVSSMQVMGWPWWSQIATPCSTIQPRKT